MFRINMCRSIQTLYGTRFGVCLPTAYGMVMEQQAVCGDQMGSSEDHPGGITSSSSSSHEHFMGWYIAHLHALATTMQLLVCVRVGFPI